MLPVVADATETCSGGTEGHEEEYEVPLSFPPPQSLADSLELGLPSLVLISGEDTRIPYPPNLPCPP